MRGTQSMPKTEEKRTGQAKPSGGMRSRKAGEGWCMGCCRWGDIVKCRGAAANALWLACLDVALKKQVGGQCNVLLGGQRSVFLRR